MGIKNITYTDSVTPYDAAAANDMTTETNNAIVSASLVLDDTNNNQLDTAINTIVHDGAAYTDTGIVNAYVLTRATAARKSPLAYTEGMKIRFTTANASSGAATVNVAGIGIKDIKDAAGAALTGGEIPANRWVELTFDVSDDAFLITNVATAAGSESVTVGGLFGFEVQTNSGDPDHDMDFAVGQANDTEFRGLLDNIGGSTIVKQGDLVFAEGTNAGGMASALTIAVDTWYRLMAIKKNDGVIDYGYDTAADASLLLASPNASAYTQYRQIGWRLTDSSANFLPIYQSGDFVGHQAAIDDFSGNTTSSATLHTVSAPPDPAVRADLTVTVSNDSVFVTPTRADDVVPTKLYCTLRGVNDGGGKTSGSAQIQILMDSNSQIRTRGDKGAEEFSINCIGYYDPRGKG